MSDQGASTTASVLGLRAGGLDCSVQLGLHRSTALRATPGAPYVNVSEISIPFRTIQKAVASICGCMAGAFGAKDRLDDGIRSRLEGDGVCIFTANR